MAENKKSFILYCDLLATVSKLPDEQAGALFKTILEYVNDMNPDTESLDLLVQVCFEPVKQQLKRDLENWRSERSKRSEAGKNGGINSGKSRRSEAKRSSASKNEANEADTVTVTVTDTVNVTDTVILSIERCGEIALADPRWVKANQIQTGEIAQFNKYLEQQGTYTMNPLDYKRYFAKLKGKYPDLVKHKFSIEELRQMAREMTAA